MVDISECRTDEKHIEMYKIKRLIKKLDTAKGNGTSMVSLYIPAKESLVKVTQRLVQEQSGAQQIKSRQTRQSVLTCLQASIERLKLYKNVPENGLIVFCGIVFVDDGKQEKKVTYDFTPFKPWTQFIYRCEGRFITEPLSVLLEDDEKFGFIIMDGNGVLYGTLQGNNRDVLQRITVQLPKKHGRGGQSAMRFARLREEKRHAYVKKVAEQASVHFIGEDNKPNVKGLVLAGSADFKTVLSQSELFDKRLAAVIVTILDVSYGQDNGFNQAITLAADSLANVKFVQEKKIIGKFFEEIALDTNMIVFGVEDTMKALDMTALDTLMLFEDIEVMRYEIRNPVKNETNVFMLTPKQEEDPKYFKDPETGVDFEVISSEQLSDWICLNYQAFGVKIEFITDKSPDGF